MDSATLQFDWWPCNDNNNNNRIAVNSINYFHMFYNLHIRDFSLAHFPYENENENETVLIGIGMTVHFEFRQFMRVAKSAIKDIFHEPTDVFWTGRAMDLLFDGIQIDCDVDKAMAQVVCDEIRDRKDPQFRMLDNGKMIFSMFAGVKFSLNCSCVNAFFTHFLPFV